MLTRHPDVGDVVRLGPGRRSSAGSRAPRRSSSSAHRRAGRRRVDRRRVWRRSGCPSTSIKPASVDARGSTPYFGVDARRRPAVRQGARRATSAAPTCCSASTARCSPATSATSGRSRRCAAAVEHEALRRARRARPRRAHARALAGVGRRPSPNGVRARLRRDRRPVARPARPGRGHRRGARRRSGTQVAELRAPPHRPPRPAPGQRVPRRRRARSGSSTSASASSPPRTCCWPPTSPSSSLRRASYVGAERAVAPALAHRRRGDAAPGRSTGCTRGR